MILSAHFLQYSLSFSLSWGAIPRKWWALCEHTGILRALIKYPAEHPEGAWRLSGPRSPDVRHQTLPTVQHRALRRGWIALRVTSVTSTDIRNYASVIPPDITTRQATHHARDTSYATWHKRPMTWHKLCYRHELCYVTYDFCCVHCTIWHKICQHEHRRGNTHASSGNVFAQTPSWEGEHTYVRFLGQVKAIGAYLVLTHANRRLVQHRGGFQYNNVLCSMQASPVRRPISLRGTEHPVNTDSTRQ
jgi:hypothetical protein